MSEVSAWIALAVLAASLWIYMFRKIRRESDRSSSARGEASRVLVLVALSIAIAGTGRLLDRENPLEDAIIITVILAAVVVIGIIINIKVIPTNKPETPRQHLWNAVTILMITSWIWVGIPYLAIVLLPAIGLNLTISLVAGAVLALVIMIYDLITGGE